MIFRLNQGYVPESYYSSRDYRVFLKLFGIQSSVFKSLIDDVPFLYSPEKCPDNLISLLSAMVGYNYNNDLPIKDNREIIKYFPYLIRYRGSELGIKLAVILSFHLSENTDIPYTSDDVVIGFNHEKGLIEIYAPNSESISQELIEVVRPVGTYIRIIPSIVTRSTDELEVGATIDVETEEYNPDRNKVDKSNVGFGDVSKSPQN